MGTFDYGYIFNDINFGVRPVIVLKQSDILVKKMIEFTINGVTYQAEEGMTWKEWINSEYNISGFFVLSYGDVLSPEGALVVDVSVDDVIIPSHSYNINYSGFP